MIRLYDLSGKELSKGINNVSPILYDVIEIRNQLLDGSVHRQTIGNPQKYITFDILSNQKQVDDINAIISQGGQFMLLLDNVLHIGFCDTGSWERITKRLLEEKNRYFTTEIRFNVIAGDV